MQGNIDFKNHYVRNVILWNRYKLRLCLKVVLLASAQKALYGTETASKEKYLDLLISRFAKWRNESKRTIGCRGINFSMVFLCTDKRLPSIE